MKETFGLTQEHQQEDPQEIQSHLVKTRHMEKKNHQRNNQIIVSCTKPQPGRNYLLKVPSFIHQVRAEWKHPIYIKQLNNHIRASY